MKIINNPIKQLRELMQQDNITCFMITKAENIRYLSGFTSGSDAILILTLEKQYIITDSRYYEQVEIECSKEWTLIKNKEPGFEFINKLNLGNETIAVEASNITLFNYNSLKKIHENITATHNLVEKLRIVKNESELELLKSAAQIGDKVFLEILNYIKPGLREKDIANKIEYFLKENGCDKESFETIAISGQKSSLPHGRPDNKQIEVEDILTLDFGGFYSGYASDMTRTIIIGKSNKKFNDYYKILLDAQKLGLSMVKEGAICSTVDKGVRDYLKKFDLDSYFVHSTGHGIGLEIHEEPRLSSTSETTLKKGMVVTVEPGIYIPGWGGIRIEDSVIVEKGGYEVITNSSKDLIII